jgi:uridine phosphorylase
VKRAWYLGATADQIAERCILVGDPARVDLFAARLETPRQISQERGLRTVTGVVGEVPITVGAFGMGAPVAAVVLEELVGLGARVVLRAGTALAVGTQPAVPLGAFVVAQAALRGEATSSTYAPLGYPAAADPVLNDRLRDELARHDVVHRIGLLASFDGFYTELVAADDARQAGVAARLAELRRLRVLAADMETSAILVAGAVLGVRAGSLCLVSVDGPSHDRLGTVERADGERRLVEIALAAIAATPLPEPRR